MSKYSKATLTIDDTDKVTLTIDDEVADQLVCRTLEVSINHLRDGIKKLLKRKKLVSYEKQDLAHSQKDLAALERAFDYYGGNLK